MLRAACCANPRCESWFINVGGNAGVPGCDSMRPCCWLLDGNVSRINKADGKRINGVASAIHVRKRKHEALPPPKRRELPPPKWDPYLPTLCGSAAGFGKAAPTKTASEPES